MDLGNGDIAVCTGRALDAEGPDNELLLVRGEPGEIGRDSGMTGMRSDQLPTLARLRFHNPESLGVVIDKLCRLRDGMVFNSMPQPLPPE